jgi:DNA-binding response OmpR family regulator
MKNLPKILIVEDNLDLCEIYRLSFEAAEFVVKIALEGLNGIVEVVDFQPDVVLLDLMMPQMNGYEFLQALKDNTSMDVTVIVCSNLSQEVDIKKALNVGADYYLKKSDFDGPSLVAKVQELLRK